ncbi:ectonucleotide pyrophosphatase/phosphodiesterase family member 5-like [Physella acuta]|uniref:ectonucleotide pyrophosphatase/phosphodiesterase family member 5-like n=1 Tax=Physella acuta TaxID=109671 RepID=UPI0027DE71F1|nr:ectonucleotide pyrophosphatase/phosphodiesterase family member 5-like [Physella acuta]
MTASLDDVSAAREIEDLSISISGIKPEMSFIVAVSLALAILPPTEGRTKVLLVSMDGFRHDYLNKTETPNFDSLRSGGVSMVYMDNSFVTNTFPCHYTMATGLFPESHGIIGNQMYDPDLHATFNMSSTEPFWWEGGEPIWITARKAGLKSGVFSWPGGDVEIFNLRPTEWRPFSDSTTFENRVSTVVSWMSEKDFDLGLLHFPEPDLAGHYFGPDSEEIISAIQKMDTLLGLLIDELNKAGLKDKIDLIVTSDHGMTKVDLFNQVIDLSQYVNETLLQRVADEEAVANLLPQPDLQVMLKEDIPERYHIKNNRRVMPVVAIAEEGWTITNNLTLLQQSPMKGSHGYDNGILNMKPIFLANGPSFKSGAIVPPIQSVDLYTLVCHILKIKPMPNNGSLERILPLLRNSSSMMNWNIVTVLLGTFVLLVFSKIV